MAVLDALPRFEMIWEHHFDILEGRCLNNYALTLKILSLPFKIEMAM